MEKIYYYLVFVCLSIAVAGQIVTEGYGYYEEDYDLGRNIPFKSVTDTNGNTYVTGMSSDEESPTGNIFTIKVNPEGEIIWEAREHTSDFIEETGYAITLDANDNPVVSGSYWNGHDMDIKTIKYDTSDGSAIWSSVFDGGRQGLDYPRVNTIDSEGNIIVAGYSYYGNTGGHSIGYSVLKYNSEGQLLWSRIKENEVNGTSSKPSDVAVDNNGNIAITGYDLNPNVFRRFYTVVYNNNGDLKWNTSYEYTSGSVYSSEAEAVRMDDDGNVYVVGTFAKDQFEFSKIGIFKYSPDGQILWEKTFADPTYQLLSGRQMEIAGDNLYIAGSFYYFNLEDPDNTYDEGTMLMAYDLNGEWQWLQKTKEVLQAQVLLQLNPDLEPSTVAFGYTPDWANYAIKLHSYDSNGNLLAAKNRIISMETGYSLATMTGFGIDQENNLYISAYSGGGDVAGEVYEVQKYTASGTEMEWTSRYSNEGASTTYFRNGKSDSEGYTIIQGVYHKYFDPWTLSVTSFIMKQDQEGNILWKNDLQTYTSNVHATAMDVNSKDEIIVALSDVYGTTITVQKYSPNGELVWQSEKETIRPEMSKIRIDEQDNIFVAGTTFRQEEPNKQQFTVLKFGDDGNEIWTNNNTSNDEEQMQYKLSAVMFDLNDNFVIVGRCGTFSSNNTAVLSVSSAGNLNWFTPVFVENALSVSGIELDIDAANNIYALSEIIIPESGYFRNRSFVTKLSPSGEIMFEKIYGDTGHSVYPYKIHMLPNNQFAIIAGDLYPNGLVKTAMVKYNQEGDELNVLRTDFSRYYRDSYVDDLGNIYTLLQAQDYDAYPFRDFNLGGAGGYIYGILQKSDIDNNTQELAFQTVERPDYYPTHLIAHPEGRLVVSGAMSTVSAPYTGIYYFESEYELLGTDDVQPADRNNWLGQNYPNPAKDTTTIPFKIEEANVVSIKLYNALGEFVQKIGEGFYSSGEHHVPVNLSGLPKGIYFYQLSGGNFVSSKKLIVK